MSVTIVVNLQAAEGNAAKLLPLLQTGRGFSRQAEGTLLTGPPDNGVIEVI